MLFLLIMLLFAAFIALFLERRNNLAETIQQFENQTHSKKVYTKKTFQKV